MDTWGTIDAYITMEFFKKKLKTKVVTQKKDPQEGIFDQEFWLPVQWPMATDRLVLKLFDEDKISDEIVGSMYFSLKKIINHPDPEGILLWKNLYGSPLGVSGSHSKQMNEEPENASTWKGRILMHLSSVDTKNPEQKVCDLDMDFKEKILAQHAYLHKDYEIICDIG